jgi:hypothetical protein
MRRTTCIVRHGKATDSSFYLHTRDRDRVREQTAENARYQNRECRNSAHLPHLSWVEVYT